MVFGVQISTFVLSLFGLFVVAVIVYLILRARHGDNEADAGDRRLWGKTGSWEERIGSDRVIRGNDQSSHLGITLWRSDDGAIKSFELNYYVYEHCLEWDGKRMHYHHYTGELGFDAAYSSVSTWKMFTEGLRPAADRMGLPDSDVDDVLAILYREAQ